MVWGKTHPGKVYHFVQVYLPLRNSPQMHVKFSRHEITYFVKKYIIKS